MVTMGNVIVEARKKQKLTQKQLGDILHVSDRTISKWERDVGYPDITFLVPLADALHIDVACLLDPKEEPDAIKDKTQSMKKVLEYAGKQTHHVIQKNLHLFYRVLLGLGVLAILICALCDYVLNRSFTWSLIVLLSISYGAIIMYGILFFKKEKIIKSVGIASIGIFILLYGIAYASKGTWFFYPGLPLTSLSILLVWIIVFIYRFLRCSYVYKLALIISLTGIFNTCVNYIANAGIIEPSALLTCVINQVVAVILVIVGIYLHYKAK